VYLLRGRLAYTVTENLLRGKKQQEISLRGKNQQEMCHVAKYKNDIALLQFAFKLFNRPSF
jgi:hypothetical protein